MVTDDPTLKEIGQNLAYALRAPLRMLPLPTTTTDYTRFALVSPARGGSTMLLHRLDSHPEIVCYGEMLNRPNIYWHHGRGSQAARILELRERDTAEFLSRHVWHRHPLGVRAVGLKILRHHFFNFMRPLLGLFDGDAVRVLFLHRENLLDQYLSQLSASETGVWNVQKEGARPTQPTFKLEPADCEAFFKLTTVSDRTLRKHFDACPVLDVTYENLVADPNGQDNVICDFLGVSRQPMEHKTVKVRTGHKSEQIENYDELRDHFRDSRWAAFFEVD